MLDKKADLAGPGISTYEEDKNVMTCTVLKALPAPSINECVIKNTEYR